MENFEIISKLGSGGFSKVYKVKRKIDNQIYALKKVQILNLSEKQKLSSLNEIRILASIKSKYVVNYKEAFIEEKDSSLCLVMEYADRGDLENRIKEQKKKGKYFNEKDIWRVFIQLVKGLKSLHELDILHRDIKSSNIFLFSDGTAKIGDLNVCKILSNNILGKTQAGTPAYAAPEVWMEKPYGLKSDIWSLGCVLYEIISLHCPFRGENIVELYNKIIIGEFSRIPNKFSDELNWIVLHMINSDPNKRLSCEELLKCQYIKKRIELNIYQYSKNNSNKILIYENETNNNHNINANSENNSDNNNNNNNDCKLYNKDKNNDKNDKLIIDENKKHDEPHLLKTIYMPNNLLYLGNHLPKPNYSSEIKNSRILKSFRSIKINTKICNSININKLKSNENNNLSKIHRIMQLSPNHLPINSNLNSLFSVNKNNINVNNNIINNIYNDIKINQNNKIKGNIKLKHINSTLITNNKNTNLSSDNNIYNRTGSQVPKKTIINNINIIKEKKEEKEKNKNKIIKSNDFIEKDIEVKSHYFLDSDKLKAILCKKRIKKNHGHKKDIKFQLKIKKYEDNEIENIRYNNCDNNNNYKQLPTDINSIENHNYKINTIIHNSINSLKNISNQNDKNKYSKDEKEFIRSENRKETFNMLPKIKLSYNKENIN